MKNPNSIQRLENTDLNKSDFLIVENKKDNKTARRFNIAKLLNSYLTKSNITTSPYNELFMSLEIDDTGVNLDNTIGVNTYSQTPVISRIGIGSYNLDIPQGFANITHASVNLVPLQYGSEINAYAFPVDDTTLRITIFDTAGALQDGFKGTLHSYTLK